MWLSQPLPSLKLISPVGEVCRGQSAPRNTCQLGSLSITRRHCCFLLPSPTWLPKTRRAPGQVQQIFPLHTAAHLWCLGKVLCCLKSEMRSPPSKDTILQDRQGLNKHGCIFLPKPELVQLCYIHNGKSASHSSAFHTENEGSAIRDENMNIDVCQEF